MKYLGLNHAFVDLFPKIFENVFFTIDEHNINLISVKSIGILKIIMKEDYQIELNRKLFSINDLLVNSKVLNKNKTGVLTGMAGIALFKFYYGRHIKKDALGDEGVKILTECIDEVRDGNIDTTYCSGITGLGWLFNHLNQEEFIDIDQELLTEMDAYIYSAMTLYIKNKNFDFLYGAMGCGLYFLKRFEQSHSVQLKLQYKDYLLELLISLHSDANFKGNTVSWKSMIDVKTGKKGKNLGLAHGMASILNILCRLYEHKDFKKDVEDLLKGAVNYFLSYKSINDTISLFPDFIINDEQPEWNSRVAWCYGDLSIAVSLWKAGKILEEKSIKDTSINILMRTALRTSRETSMVIDAGICHGSFGNAQLFNYMYEQTKIENFRNAANFWINDGLHKANHSDGYAGYKKMDLDGWKNEISVLEGIAGIGLVLISHLSGKSNKWDECLLIS